MAGTTGLDAMIRSHADHLAKSAASPALSAIVSAARQLKPSPLNHGKASSPAADSPAESDTLEVEHLAAADEAAVAADVTSISSSRPTHGVGDEQESSSSAAHAVRLRVTAVSGSEVCCTVHAWLA